MSVRLVRALESQQAKPVNRTGSEHKMGSALLDWANELVDVLLMMGTG